MKNKLKIVCLGVFSIYIIPTLILNIICLNSVNRYEELTSFLVKEYNISTDNFNIPLNLNPFSTLLLISTVNTSTDNIQNILLDNYETGLSNINLYIKETEELLLQAKKLNIKIINQVNKEFLINNFSKIDSFDFGVVKSLRNQENYLTDFYRYLKTVFFDFKQAKLKMKAFSNPLWGMTDREINEMIAIMTNDEKAGQMLMFSIPGYSLNESQILNLKDLKPGGVIIMSQNASGTRQLEYLTQQIQSLNPNIPMFIPTDQEGGPVKRISWDDTSGEKSWINLTDNELCDQAKERANLLLDLGINMNFSPVVDVAYPGSFINTRAISNDANIVQLKSKIYITCSQELGIIDTLKHFPGHGPTNVDSHYSLPVVNKTRSEWLLSDALPFKNNLDTKQIMVGHLVYTDIDPDNPSTLSKIFLTDILRNDWGYKGLIITDDMNMLHTSTKISVNDALNRTFNAGVDIAIYVGTPTSESDIKNQLVKLLAGNTIPAAKVNEILARILFAKRDLVY